MSIKHAWHCSSCHKRRTVTTLCHKEHVVIVTGYDFYSQCCSECHWAANGYSNGDPPVMWMYAYRCKITVEFIAGIVVDVDHVLPSLCCQGGEREHSHAGYDGLFRLLYRPHSAPALEVVELYPELRIEYCGRLIRPTAPQSLHACKPVSHFAHLTATAWACMYAIGAVPRTAQSTADGARYRWCGIATIVCQSHTPCCSSHNTVSSKRRSHNCTHRRVGDR